MSRWFVPVIGVIAFTVNAARWWVGVQNAPLWLDIAWWATLVFLIVWGVKNINERFR
jgi:hypothetical protein